MCTSVALLTVLLPPRSASAADIVVSGALERLLGTSIFVRLADDRLIDARLPPTTDLAAETIATHYSLGDQVEITCKSIQTVYDQDMALHQHLELKKLKLLRRASQEGLAQVVARLSRQGGANLLKHSAVASPKDTPATAEALLEHVRRVNLDFAANLPNFVADETGTRYTISLAAKDWRNVDVIESEVTFRGGRATREHIRLNGKLPSADTDVPVLTLCPVISLPSRDRFANSPSILGRTRVTPSPTGTTRRAVVTEAAMAAVSAERLRSHATHARYLNAGGCPTSCEELPPANDANQASLRSYISGEMS